MPLLAAKVSEVSHFRQLVWPQTESSVLCQQLRLIGVFSARCTQSACAMASAAPPGTPFMNPPLDSPHVRRRESTFVLPGTRVEASLTSRSLLGPGAGGGQLMVVL